MRSVRWTVEHESGIAPDGHAELAALLRAAFPAHRDSFPDRRSWSGTRPERRVVGRDDAGPAAHVGFVRHTVEVVAGGDLPVALVGLVCVRPDLQGTGVGRELLAGLHDELHRLDVPFGLLGTDPDRYAFYRSCGWQSLPDVTMRYSPIDTQDPSRTVADRDGWHVLPVARTLADWPPGEIWWNATMI